MTGRVWGLRARDESTAARRHWAEGIKDKAPALTLTSMATSQAEQLVVCVSNEGYPASLERRKIYVALRDADAEKHGLIRIVDESGDDYLYSKALLRTIALPDAVKRAVLAA